MTDATQSVNFTAYFQNIEPSITVIAAVIAVVISIIGGLFSFIKQRSERRAWKDEMERQKDQWKQKFADQRTRQEKEHEVEISSRFLNELIKERFRTYPAVFKTLGEVQDCPDPKQRHWELIRQNPKMLFTIADDIINHLYHEAGLFMSYKTRNTLLTLYTYCYMYQTNEVKFDEVVVQFWKARRKLRMDLQIEDTGEFSELSQIMKRLQLSNK